jgi:hypothetical protein
VFDLSIETLGVDVEEDGHFITLKVVGGHTLPIAQNGKPIQFPSSIIRAPLDRGAALKLSELLKEAADKLPESKLPEDFHIASNIREAEEAAGALDKLKK